MHDHKKLVVAHFMVGNTYPYTRDSWLEDIRLAQKNNIDGFALNLGTDDWQAERISDCFEAAKNSTFKLFLSFDMAVFPSAKSEDINTIRTLFSKFASHPNYLRIDDKALVSTFAGENSLFGHGDLSSAWAEVKETLGSVTKVCLVPSFFLDPKRLQGLNSIDGAFHWNGSWPIQLKPDSPKSEVELPELCSDADYVANLRNKLYMASVSPWFFTHYGKDTWNKNWIYRGDDWLFVRRWEHLMSIRSQVDIVQLISWNDYGESHYIGPIKGAQPNSQAWVDGFEHTPWLHLSAFFARAFKDGHYPRIEKFRVYAWARPHRRDANIGRDTVGRPTGWQLTEDFFWVVVLAPSPAQVELRSNPNETPTTQNIPAGVQKLKHPFIPGGGIFVKVKYAGKTVIDFDAGGFKFAERPESYNFNAFVAMCPEE